jgi:hypothetical protein
MKKLAPVVLALAAVGGAAFVLAQCGGSVCGNGKQEPGEQCDQGDRNGMPGVACTAECKQLSIITPKLQVSWARLRETVQAYPNYPDATCAALGIDKVRVAIDGPTPSSEDIPCAMMNTLLKDGVAPGMYTVTITMLDSTGAAISRPKSSMPTDVQATGQPTDVKVELSKDDYVKQDYTGTLYFMPNWGMSGGTCSAQMVGQTSVRLTPRGSSTPVMKMTSTMPTRLLDGTVSGCFVQMGTDLTEKAPGLAWGHYDMTITGTLTTSAQGTVDFCQKFGVFVGPGVANPSFQLVVPRASVDPDGGASSCP